MGFGPPSPEVDRGHLGSNPAVVDRLWEVLNESLPADARWLVFDSAALVHPASNDRRDRHQHAAAPAPSIAPWRWQAARAGASHFSEA